MNTSFPITEVFYNYGLTFSPFAYQEGKDIKIEDSLNTQDIYANLFNIKLNKNMTIERQHFLLDYAVSQVTIFNYCSIADLTLWRKSFNINENLIRFPEDYLLRMHFVFYPPGDNRSPFTVYSSRFSALSHTLGKEKIDILKDLDANCYFQSLFNPADAERNFKKVLSSYIDDFEASFDAERLECFKKEVLSAFYSFFDSKIPF